jgi:hypothetical protein
VPQESASAHFSWLGFASFLLSMVFEALRVVLVERLLGKERYNAIEVRPCCLLLPCAQVFMQLVVWLGKSNYVGHQAGDAPATRQTLAHSAVTS